MSDDTPAELDAKDAAFVSEFMKDGNAVAAAQRSGHRHGAAARLLARADIAAEIARRKAPSDSQPAAGAVSLQSLIDDAQRALKVAEEFGNASAMVAATTLLARLVGKADGEAPELTQPKEVDTRDLTRTLMRMCSPEELKRLKYILMARGEGRVVATAEAGEVLMRVPKGLAHTVNFPEAIEIPLQRSPKAMTPNERLEAAAAPRPDVVETSADTFSNGARIVFEQDTAPSVIDRRGRAQPAGRPRTFWAVYHGAVRHSRHLTREDAVACAKALPAKSKV